MWITEGPNGMQPNSIDPAAWRFGLIKPWTDRVHSVTGPQLHSPALETIINIASTPLRSRRITQDERERILGGWPEPPRPLLPRPTREAPNSLQIQPNSQQSELIYQESASISENEEEPSQLDEDPTESAKGIT